MTICIKWCILAIPIAIAKLPNLPAFCILYNICNIHVHVRVYEACSVMYRCILLPLILVLCSCWGSCSVPVFTTSWMKSEDLGVIIADKGMIDHHMPTHVIDTLRAYHKHVSVETSELFTREWVDNQRNEQLMTTIRDKIEKREIQLEERADGMGSDEVDGGQAQVDGILEVEEVEQGWETAVDIEGRGVCDGSRVREPLGDGSLAGDMTDVADIPETLAGHGGSSDLVGGARVLAGEATDTETVLVVERYQNDDNEYFELHSVGTHNSNSV